MTRSPEAYQLWDVVVVPFPFTDKQATKVRPAVVVSHDVLKNQTGKYFLAMVTSAVHAPCYGDISVSNLALTGLPCASVVRVSKLATLEQAAVHKRIGILPKNDQELIIARLNEFLGHHADQKKSAR